MRSWVKVGLWLLAAVLVVGLAVALLGRGKGRKQDKDPGADAPVPVTVVAAGVQSVPVFVNALGTVNALNKVTVAPQIGGELLSIDFREGQEVKQGDLLARIDPRTAQASYDQAAASKRQNQAQLATARSNYQRSNAPEYRQYVSKTDLDTQRNQVAQLESAVAANDAAMRQAQVQLQYTRVTAPISGIAGLRSVDVGNVLNAGTALVTLTQVHPIHVLFNLPERQLQGVREAQRAGPVMVGALDRGDAHALTADGRLDVVDNQISADSGTFRARAVFDNADNALWPGQFVNVRLRLRTIESGLVVPVQAVMRGTDSEYVYVVQADNTVAMRTVKTGVEADDNRILVVSGLKAGERVVTEGQFRLKPGSKVTALAPGDAGKPAPAKADAKPSDTPAAKAPSAAR
ncbi:efflux RND transporter periplasmic adaptor subunit [Lysobacter enzymogenes]|uniref:efflux RND transporter periplasmic adaptor subunit n=1 Tax=Lysobacter enzymogenes TaxID=69 RepID=UPI001A9602AE|nr:efflux RND transporter periplasmic adaptor subunit [Lysobacter enzymogenes]QQP97140.1 efflux RND transporter periplasmic adaptor subunit [Lysobacter enzymogenes]